jgi:hypothetical protein
MANFDFGISNEENIQTPGGAVSGNPLVGSQNPIQQIGSQSVLTKGEFISPNYKKGSVGWKLGAEGDIEAANLFLTGGTIRYGKTSFADTVNPGYFIGSTGFYFGSANDAKYIKYNLATGDLTLYGNTVTNPTITGIQAGSEISIQGWIHTLTFSVTDADTVAWTSGSIRLMDSTTYSISAGNTGNMTAETYIYLDVGTSTTVLQTTTTKTNAVGSGKILICVAQNGTDEASFVDFGSKNLNIPGTSIVAGSITANEIAANTITANKLSVSTLDAVSANMGTLTAGTINGGTIIGNVKFGAGNLLFASADTTKYVNEDTYAKKKDITCNRGGTLRIKFSYQNTGGGAGDKLYVRVYKNGEAYGTEYQYAQYESGTQSEDITGWSAGDSVQLYAKLVPNSAPNTTNVANFRIYVDNIDTYTVVID